ncbi:YciI family protein [Parasphingorhabdus cellanae]|uniref:YciI family protein n=1 Tax=Parasphingorhabdus cellanae TaxID=2806553 RepID=A0ABX7T2X9_9SPHN|nr:YciI family protein [Parasphingorhabdus cellanae]QTD55162.1 YciI family protein [Parasphingorhabdus cellanae]
MKAFAIYCTDKPDTEQKRLDTRSAHFAHIETTLDNLFVAGPFKNAHGDTVGSLLIVKAETEADARAQLEADPYFHADIWADIRIHEFTAAAGDWIGGKIW